MTNTTESIDTKRKNNSEKIKRRSIFYIVIVFITSFLLSGAEWKASSVCLSAAFVSAAGAGMIGLSSLIGSCLGYSFFFGFDDASIYIASAVVVYTVSFVFQYSALYQMKYFSSISVALVIGLASAFGVVSTVRSNVYYSHQMIEIGLCALLSYVYKEFLQSESAFGRELEFHHKICFLICIYSFVISFERYSVFDFSVGKIVNILTFLILVCTLDRSSLCVYILILSVFSNADQSSNFDIWFSVYGLLCVILDLKGKFVPVLMLCVCVCGYSIMNEGNDVSVFFEFLTASLIFLVIPRKFIASVRHLLQGDDLNAIFTSYVKQTEANEKLSEVIKDIIFLLNVSKNESTEVDTMDAFEMAIERVCLGCVRKEVCWENHRDKIGDMFWKIKKSLEERGRIDEEDFSEWFKDYCLYSLKLSDEINYELRNRVAENILNQKFEEKYDSMLEIIQIISNLMYRDQNGSSVVNEKLVRLEKKVRCYLYSFNCDCDVTVSSFGDGKTKIELHGKGIQMALKRNKFLDELSEIMNMRLRVMKERCAKETLLLYEAEPYAVSVGIATKKKKGERVCGDSHSYFKTEYGRFYVILSDGLGSGEHAKKQSRMLIDLIERFLICELQPNEVVHLASLIMSLNNKELWDCATLDLFCLDLYTGNAEIYKIGAAPSYWYHCGEVSVLLDDTFGFGGYISTSSQFYKESFCIDSGDILVLRSDGITVDDSRVLNKMIHDEETSMKNLARSILLEHQNEDECGDDMTVITIKMEFRK